MTGSSPVMRQNASHGRLYGAMPPRFCCCALAHQTWSAACQRCAAWRHSLAGGPCLQSRQAESTSVNTASSVVLAQGQPPIRHCAFAIFLCIWLLWVHIFLDYSLNHSFIHSFKDAVAHVLKSIQPIAQNMCSEITCTAAAGFCVIGCCSLRFASPGKSDWASRLLGVVRLLCTLMCWLYLGSGSCVSFICFLTR